MNTKALVVALIVTVVFLGALLVWVVQNDSTRNQSQSRSQETLSDDSPDVKSLPKVESTQVEKLSNGAVFEMRAEMVQQEIGNRTIRRLAYNRQIPGPLLQVEKDATITLRLANMTDVPTTLHSHGLRLDNRFDGVPNDMHGTQQEVGPGETFDYTLTFPDAGVFWYHPHIREDYTQEMGLYGNYSVTEAGYWSDVDQEQFLVFDDFNPDEAFSPNVINHTLMGRFGNELLINNQENYRLQIKQGEVARLFLTNTANARPFHLTFPGARVKLVGGDIGRIEHEKWINDLILAPAERAVIEVSYGVIGEFSIQNRGVKMGMVEVQGSDAASNMAQFETLRTNSNEYQSIRDTMDVWLQKTPDKKLRMSIDMHGMGGMNGGMGHGMMHGSSEANLLDPESGIEWEDTMAMMNRMSTDKNITWQLIDDQTGKINDDITPTWNFTQGDMVKVELYNDPESDHPMQHPIHFHGQRFVILSRNGQSNDDLQWKDTTLVRVGEKVELLVEMGNPGMWLAHCHIAEHMHAGMMFGFMVEKK